MSLTKEEIIKMTDNTLKQNGWSEYGRFVLSALDDLKKQYECSEAKIDANREAYVDAINQLKLEVVRQIGELKGEIKVINTKITQRAAIIGFIGGFLPALAVALYAIIKL